MSRQTVVTIRYAALRCLRFGVSKTFTYDYDARRVRGTRRAGVVIPLAYREDGY